ncbi:hypothetical protein ACFFHH_03415 [Cytobacillus solani]|uniref:hypothetical protein n=1 Tax=Cytobacillus solani TaxID=1637975 RepID=UPI00114E621F|nr:hypothetical protein [Cytobacillus solani]
MHTMYIITSASNVILAVTMTATRNIYGNIETSDGIVGVLNANILKVETVPEGVAPFTYCYTPEKGFYPYVEPPEPVPEQSENELLMSYVIDVDYRVTMIELGLV